MGRNKLKKYLCPICSNYYFTELSKEEIEEGIKMEDDFCTICGWHYVKEQVEDHSLVTEINKMSFDDYKKWYENKKKENPEYNYLEDHKPSAKPHICPVCGKYEFSDEFSYDICPYCGWEDDGFEAEHHKNHKSSVGYTFAEYKKIYENLVKENPNYKWKDKL